MTFPSKAFVVSHTHWDREWYKTQHQFRVDLARVVRQVLDALEEDPDYRHFVLDGQAIVLEDHLAIHPEDEPRVRALVEAGALAIGPWYVLPDEFLVGPESHVRNVMLGHATARRFGAVQKVGYMPDSFGHVAQVPQLLAQSGIESFVYTRGNGDEIDELGAEWHWRAPDGSEVLAIHQVDGYCNCGALGLEDLWLAHTPREVDPALAVTKVREVFEKMRPLCRTDVALLNNGCDHFPPQRDFGRVLAALREGFPETEFRHASLAEFVDAVRDAERDTDAPVQSYTGELAGGRFHHILSGVWSARMPLKQENEQAQTWLEAVAEPAACWSRFLLGRDYPAGELEAAWKLLLQNHPHDSICGCSVDEVHRDMGPRFDGVIQTASQLVRRELQTVTPTFGRRAAGDRATVLTVLNPLPQRRSAVIDRLVVLQPMGYDTDRLVLIDGDGLRVPCEIRAIDAVERFWGIDYRTKLDGREQLERYALYREQFGDRMLLGPEQRDAGDLFVSIRFLAQDLPAVGHASYYFSDGPSGPDVPPPSRSVRVEGTTLENDHVAVTVHANGSFDLVDKASGRRFSGLNVFEDEEDVGDEYDYSPCPNPGRLTSEACTGDVHVVDAGPWRGALEVRFALELPARITVDRRRRVDETVRCDVTTRISLELFERCVQVETEFENLAEDHRLRVVFPTGLRSDTVWSDGHFYVNERPVDVEDRPEWVQPPSGTIPQQEFSAVQDAEGGLAVLERGLPELQATRADDGTVDLHLTLLRSVGWLSRDDFPTRRCQNAGPTLPTPDAQCLGPQRFVYAVAPFTSDWIEAGVKDLSRRWRTPLPTIQGVEDGHVKGGTGLVRARTGRASITAIKRHGSRDTAVVRLYNLTPEPLEETLVFGRSVASAWRTDLLEERTEALVPGGHDVRVTLRGHEIYTVEVAFA